MPTARPNTCLLLFVLALGLLEITVKAQECVCSDLQPQTDEGLTCEQQRDLGRCTADWMRASTDAAPDGFCLTTCGFCPCPDAPRVSYDLPVFLGDADCTCSDLQPTADLTCTQQKEMGYCLEDWMRNTQGLQGGFCQITCGFCPCSNPRIEGERPDEIPEFEGVEAGDRIPVRFALPDRARENVERLMEPMAEPPTDASTMSSTVEPDEMPGIEPESGIPGPAPESDRPPEPAMTSDIGPAPQPEDDTPVPEPTMDEPGPAPQPEDDTPVPGPTMDEPGPAPEPTMDEPSPTPEPDDYDMPVPEPDDYDMPVPEPDDYDMPVPEPDEYDMPVPEPDDYDMPVPEPDEYDMPVPEPDDYDIPVPEPEEYFDIEPEFSPMPSFEPIEGPESLLELDILGDLADDVDREEDRVTQVFEDFDAESFTRGVNTSVSNAIDSMNAFDNQPSTGPETSDPLDTSLAPDIVSTEQSSGQSAVSPTERPVAEPPIEATDSPGPSPITTSEPSSRDDSEPDSESTLSNLDVQSQNVNDTEDDLPPLEVSSELEATDIEEPDADEGS